MGQKDQLHIKGRGTQTELGNRFERYQYDSEHEWMDFSLDELHTQVKTKYLEVFPKTLVNQVPSKDIYLNFSMNPYQGCEHGCAYCYARPTHEYWGYNPGLDFERTILYKPNAAKLLENFLSRKKWKPQAIMLSGNTDCYQPAERKFELTRSLLKVLNTYKNPVGIITKNAMVIRDIDVLSEMAKDDLVRVVMSITTLDEDLRARLEPRTSTAKNKLKAIERLSLAGVPVQVMIGPVIPGLNSHEIPKIIEECAKAGADWANYVMVRLNGPVADVFTDWLKKNYPDRSNKVLNQIKEVNGGVLSNTIGGRRVTGKGTTATLIKNMFEIHRSRHMKKPDMQYNTSLFKVPGSQFNLFD